MVVIVGEALHAVNVRGQVEHFLFNCVTFLVCVLDAASDIDLDRGAWLTHGSIKQLVLMGLSQHVESLVLIGCENRLIGRCIMQSLLIWLELSRWENCVVIGAIWAHKLIFCIVSIASLLIALVNLLALLLLLLLLDYVLQDSVASLSSYRHIAVLFKFGVVALRLLWNTVPEQSTGERLVLIFNWEYFVKSS